MGFEQRWQSKEAGHALRGDDRGGMTRAAFEANSELRLAARLFLLPTATFSWVGLVVPELVDGAST
jgi:hypothetical protein